MLGYLGVYILHRTLTWTTGSLTCVCDLFACVYNRGTSVYSLIRSHRNNKGTQQQRPKSVTHGNCHLARKPGHTQGTITKYKSESFVTSLTGTHTLTVTIYFKNKQISPDRTKNRRKHTCILYPSKNILSRSNRTSCPTGDPLVLDLELRPGENIHEPLQE